MKKSLISLAIVALSIGAAHARNDGPSNNNGPTFGGNTTVTASPSASAAALSQSSATGIGVGVGMGGAGGNASATGGSASAGVNSAIRNDVSNTSINANTNSLSNRNDLSNVQGQHQGQGQLQGQLQGQSQNAISGGNKLTNEGNNSQQQTKVTVEGDTYQAAKIPVATAYAAPLAASNGTCFGSASGGAQGPGFGISFGKTLFDENCDIRYDAEALRAAGLPAAAQARLCQKPEIASAMEAAGTPCPGQKKAASAPSGASVTAVPAPAVQTSQYVGSDPIVMQRLGIAPLAK